MEDLISLYLTPNSDAIFSELTKYIISFEYIISFFNKAAMTFFPTPLFPILLSIFSLNLAKSPLLSNQR